jgi:ABC-type multidrug transport system fused ATPase/permease subunit
MVGKKKVNNYSSKKFFKDIWNLVEGKRIKFIFYVCLRAVSELGAYAIILLLGLIIDFFTSYQTGDSLTRFYIYVILIAFAGTFQVWARVEAKMKNAKLAAKMRMKVREISMTQLMDIELKWHETEGTGSKIEKIYEGSKNIYRFFTDFVNNKSVNVIIAIIASLSIFIFLNWIYAVFGAVYALIFLVIEYYYIKRLNYWRLQLNKISEKVSGKIHESASNVLSVKSLGLRKSFEESTKKYEEKHYKIWLNKTKIGLTRLKMTKMFGALGYAAFIILVGYDFIASTITLGSILIFVAYFEKLRNALYNTSEMIDNYNDIRVSTGRLMTILGKKVFDRESENLLEVPQNWKKIEFKNADFYFKQKKVLNNFNMIINRGEKIGVVGRSGCGKSTITKLLLGLYKVRKGGIYIDGVDINKFKHSSITNTITAVLQDSEMFDMSLADNITISSIKKDNLKLQEAIKISSLLDVIKRLPNGLSTLLGEKGYKVSGGERQRIGIARAVYKDSPMIILDEATSHLDSKTELEIQKSLEKNLKNKTLLVVAHRLSTLKEVDKIVVMDKGQIVEQGKFKDLIKNQGKFYELYRLQRSK